MIGWEERGSVDGSEERRWVTGLMEGSICKWKKSICVTEPGKRQMNVKLSRCLINNIMMYGRIG
jgi:hypothetical protein